MPLRPLPLVARASRSFLLTPAKSFSRDTLTAQLSRRRAGVLCRPLSAHRLGVSTDTGRGRRPPVAEAAPRPPAGSLTPHLSVSSAKALITNKATAALVGKMSTLAYDLPGDPLKITAHADPFGRTATFTYTAARQLASLTDVGG